jgi:hypothetical protein
MVTCICKICGKEFLKPQNEYNRRIRLGVKEFYCSRNCVGYRKDNINMLSKIGKPNHFKGGENKHKTDEDIVLGGLKEFSRRIKRRKQYIVDISADELLLIWKKQNGKCAITGVDLILPNNRKYRYSNNNYKASIDRIDSSQPYKIDNIQFLSATMNYLKNDMNQSDLDEFLMIVKSL